MGEVVPGPDEELLKRQGDTRPDPDEMNKKQGDTKPDPDPKNRVTFADIEYRIRNSGDAPG